MEGSSSYVAGEKMIRQRKVMLSEPEHMLEALQKQEQITPVEHEALLKLAWIRSINNLSSA